MKFIEDKELNLNEKENDLLNGKSYVETLKNIIKNAPRTGTFTIGLFGEWGSGKSSIIKTVKDEITKNNKEYGSIRFVIYDAWKYVQDSFRRMFLLNLQKELKQEKTDLMEKFYCNKTVEQTIKLKFSSQKFYWIFVMLFVASVVAIIALPSVSNDNNKIWTLSAFIGFIISLLGLLVNVVFRCFNELKTSTNVPLMFAPEQFEDCFKDILSNALKKNTFTAIRNWVKGNTDKNDKIIIVIDNIDRCSSDRAYELLTDIKNFMGNYDNLVFIIPIDDTALKKHLIKNNNSNRDAEEFLRKFFNVELRIKPLENVELYDFADNLNKKYKLNFRPDTISIIANDYATNPRRIIQLCNNLTSEINVLSKSCDKEFIEKNESVICKALIIKEEWPEYYRLMLSDNSLLKAQSFMPEKGKDNDKKLDSFLRRTFFLTQNVDISVIETILSNKVSFQNLPKNILDAISSFEIQPLIEYISISNENNDLCVKYLLDRLKKNMDRKNYGSDVIKTFIALIAINEKSKLSDINNTKIQTIVAEKIREFIIFVPTQYFSTLGKYLNDLGNNNYFAKEIGQYFRANMENEGNISDNVVEMYKQLLITCNDINEFKEYFLHWYKQSDEALSQLPLDAKIGLLVTKGLLEYEFEHIKDMSDKERGIDDLEFIAKYGNLEEEHIATIINMIQSKVLTYNGNNTKPMLSMLANVTNIIKNFHISDIKSFQTLYNNIFKTISINYQQKTLLDGISDDDARKIVIDFLETSYISSLGKITTNTQLKTLFEKNITIRPYIISSIKNISNEQLPIGVFKDCILNTTNISVDYLYILEKLINEIKDENFVIDDNIVKQKLEILIENVQNPEQTTLINSFFENNISSNRIQEFFIQLVSVASKEIILTLSPKLQKYAFDNICKNLEAYINEKPLLEAIADSNNKKYLSALIQQIQTHLINNNDYEYWKNLYEKIDEIYIADKDKRIIQSILSKELDETETTKETA
ncbi:MAG: hypothetical protein J6N45_00180 [Alphaproteobacteria bacterium]|nr:hypothetical protein [Alphaproteobacteria bacterium]